VLAIATFAKPNTLAGTFAEEVQLGSADNRSTLDFDLFDFWRVERKLTLNTFASHNTTNHEHFARPGPAASDDGAAENLDPFFVAFLDLGVNVDRVTDPKFVNLFLEEGTLDRLEDLLAHDQRQFRQKVSETNNLDRYRSQGVNMVTNLGCIGKAKNRENRGFGPLRETGYWQNGSGFQGDRGFQARG